MISSAPHGQLLDLAAAIERQRLASERARLSHPSMHTSPQSKEHTPMTATPITPPAVSPRFIVSCDGPNSSTVLERSADGAYQTLCRCSDSSGQRAFDRARRIACAMNNAGISAWSPPTGDFSVPGPPVRPPQRGVTITMDTVPKVPTEFRNGGVLRGARS